MVDETEFDIMDAEYIRSYDLNPSSESEDDDLEEERELDFDEED